jgi:hypothetical protein
MERNAVWWLAVLELTVLLIEGRPVMPRYFFHLRFGQRFVPDEEGVDLPSRSAARDEALAAVRDLAKPQIGGNSRRWASWFLEVADEQGRFFRAPLGYPALELVTEDRAEQPAPIPTPIRSAAFAPLDEARVLTAEIVREIRARHAHTARLLEVNQRLQNELWSLCRASEVIRDRTRQVLSLARAAGGRH